MHKSRPMNYWENKRKNETGEAPLEVQDWSDGLEERRSSGRSSLPSAIETVEKWRSRGERRSRKGEESSGLKLRCYRGNRERESATLRYGRFWNSREARVSKNSLYNNNTEQREIEREGSGKRKGWGFGWWSEQPNQLIEYKISGSMFSKIKDFF